MNRGLAPLFAALLLPGCPEDDSGGSGGDLFGPPAGGACEVDADCPSG